MSMSAAKKRSGILSLLAVVSGLGIVGFALPDTLWIRVAGELGSLLLLVPVLRAPARSAQAQENVPEESPLYAAYETKITGVAEEGPSDPGGPYQDSASAVEDFRLQTEVPEPAGKDADEAQRYPAGGQGEFENRQVKIVHALGSLLHNKAQVFPVMVNQLKAVIDATDNAAMGLSKSFMNINTKAKRQAKEVEEIFGDLSDRASTERAPSDGAPEEQPGEKQGELVGLWHLLNGLIDSIREITGQIKAQQEATAQILKNTSSLHEIVAKSSNISENSRVLAINAAIEAARAGEQGRGFAVVAGEFKQLTEDSQQATREIADIVQEVSEGAESLVRQTREGVRKSEKAAGEAEHEVKEALTRIDTLMDTTRGRMEELSRHAESLAKDISNIVVSIQFQDITRQRIEHVIEPLQEFAEEFSNLGDTVLSFERLEDLLSQSAQSYAERLESTYTMESEKEVMRHTMKSGSTKEGDRKNEYQSINR